MYICVYMCIYIYIYIYAEARERQRQSASRLRLAEVAHQEAPRPAAELSFANSLPPRFSTLESEGFRKADSRVSKRLPGLLTRISKSIRSTFPGSTRSWMHDSRILTIQISRLCSELRLDLL